MTSLLFDPAIAAEAACHRAGDRFMGSGSRFAAVASSLPAPPMGAGQPNLRFPASCNVADVFEQACSQQMTLRAMIVDDNLEFLLAARGLLERQGITVIAMASNGAAALRGVEEHSPDVVLVDVDLGDESGFEVAGRISPPTGRGTPVVLISAYPEQDLQDLIEASAAIGFVSKTRLSADAILELLDRCNRTDETRSG